MAGGSDARAAQFLAEGAAPLRPESVENAVPRTVRVLLPLPLADAYDYSVPEGLDVAPGRFVVVPLGRRETLGVVWGGGTGEVPAAKLRDVIGVLPALPMVDALRRFVDWVAAYTLAPPGAVLRMAMSAPSALEAPRTELVYRPATDAAGDTLKLTAARRRVLEALKEGAALAAGRQVLVLLPEIALTAQWLKRFEDRFGCTPAPWHSGLTSLERRETWRAIAQGRIGVVVGARSALFLPFAQLGLIVVDEEHDTSFKQEEGVCYNARDMAVVRARLVSAPIVLASATPSLESVTNVTSGRYGALHLPDRHGGQRLAVISAVDLRKYPPDRGRWLSPPVVDAMRKTLAAGEQTLLFLNRRGYAPITLCRACVHGIECPQCSAWLVEHRFRRTLICHHCGHSESPTLACKSCGAADQFVPCGPGVERLAEEALGLFPQARIELFTSDTLMNRNEASEAIDRMTNGEID